jgi:PAS domain-containing protein
MRRPALAGVTVTVACVAALSYHPGGDGTAQVVSDAGLLAAALLAGLVGLRRASAGAASHRAWLLTALSCFLWAGGQAIWTVAQLIYDQPLPFPSLGDVAFPAAIGVAIGSLFAFPPERRHAEQALRQSDERLRSLVEASPLAIIEYDRDGAVRFWNAAAQTLDGAEALRVADGHAGVIDVLVIDVVLPRCPGPNWPTG